MKRSGTKARGVLRFGIAGVTAAALLMAGPLGSASADPEPSLKELSKQVEEMHVEIETLTENYNGQREKLKAAQKSVQSAKRTLAASESVLRTKVMRTDKH